MVDDYRYSEQQSEARMALPRDICLIAERRWLQAKLLETGVTIVVGCDVQKMDEDRDGLELQPRRR